MTWFKCDDHLHSHSKSMRAGTEAMGLWVLAGSWSAAEESDGWVPDYVLGRLVGANGDALAARLVKAELWHGEERDGETGFQFHAWDEYQPTAEQLDRKREAQRERMRVARNGTRQAAPKPAAPSGGQPHLTIDPVGDAFAGFWDAYPNKTGKAAAEKAYAKAVKTVTPDTIATGLANAVAVWTAQRTEKKFIPHPATWLNQGRWDDVHDPIPGTVPTTARPSRTLNQCNNEECPGVRHEWYDQSNDYICLGV